MCHESHRHCSSLMLGAWKHIYLPIAALYLMEVN